MKRNKKNGFTLVELLAVIVILAIILVIAVPKVMSIIEDAKMGTLESTAKMIASQAEKQKVQNAVLGNDKEITCDSVAKINDVDYASCDITFDDNTAKVTIEGSGKFLGLWVCGGTKTEAIAIKESCIIESLEVKHPIFLKGQELTTDKFQVIASYNDGRKEELKNGKNLVVDESQIKIISTPNWPEIYLPIRNSYNDNFNNDDKFYYNWNFSFEKPYAIQIIFDEKSGIGYGYIGVESFYDKLYINDHSVDKIANKIFKIFDNNVKLTLDTYYVEQYFDKPLGFRATINPLYKEESEFSIFTNFDQITDGDFEITITVNGQSESKKILLNAGSHDIVDYLVSHKGFDTVQTNAEYEGITYDTGIRYTGYINEVNNKVYYNCDDIDANGVVYGEKKYDYTNSCEVWRIIGVFDTKSSDDGNAVPRVKLINTASTFQASWDYSDREINSGYGVNQWGPSTYSDGSIYEGADLMQFLNGYYIGKENSTCTYTNYFGNKTCTNDSLKNANMKVLTTTAKKMIENAVWDTYAIESLTDAGLIYLQEKGISAQYLGRMCNGGAFCSDKVERTTSWTGLVGLMSASDMIYAGEWLDTDNKSHCITPYYGYHGADAIGLAGGYRAGLENNVYPTVYLKSNIKVISGNGADKPYVLALN